ncbi:MAG: hypothetical protein JXB49_29225 [Bacteroidales bacterium]|nr:hypothetical protein [Bacteroidales bacterium]
MRPPICAICEKDFRAKEKQGGGIQFKLSEDDKEHNRRMEEKGFTGHPAGFEWFCIKHIRIARKYKHLTWAEARPLIKNESEKGRLLNWLGIIR